MGNTSSTETSAKTKKTNICGQACAFQTAQEAMSVIGLYFQDYFVGQSENQERGENVKKCLNPTASSSGCDVKELLDSSLHYAMGKAIRHNVLQNTTNANNMQTLGYIEDIEKSLESGWDRDQDIEDTMYFSLLLEDVPEYELQDLDLRIELNERENFRISRNIAQQTMKGDKNKSLQEFQTYLNNYAGPEESLFSASREIPQSNSISNSELIMKEPATSVLKGEYEYEIEKNKYTHSEKIHSELQGKLKEGKEALKEEINEELKENGNAKSFPLVKLSKREGEAQKAAKGILACIPPPKNCGNGLEENTEKLEYLLTEQEIKKLKDNNELTKDALLTNKLKKIAGNEIHEIIASQINTTVDKILQDRKNKQPKKIEHVTYQINIQAFDKFLDEMWPNGSN